MTVKLKKEKKNQVAASTLVRYAVKGIEEKKEMKLSALT